MFGSGLTWLWPVSLVASSCSNLHLPHCGTHWPELPAPAFFCTAHPPLPQGAQSWPLRTSDQLPPSFLLHSVTPDEPLRPPLPRRASRADRAGLRALPVCRVRTVVCRVECAGDFSGPVSRAQAARQSALGFRPRLAARALLHHRLRGSLVSVAGVARRLAEPASHLAGKRRCSRFRRPSGCTATRRRGSASCWSSATSPFTRSTPRSPECFGRGVAVPASPGPSAA